MTAKADTIITLQPIQRETLRIRVVGDTPLVVHQFDEKSRRQLLDTHMHKAKQAKDTRYHQARVRCYVRWLCLCAGCSMHVQWQTSCAIDNSRALALDL